MQVKLQEKDDGVVIVTNEEHPEGRYITLFFKDNENAVEATVLLTELLAAAIAFDSMRKIVTSKLEDSDIDEDEYAEALMSSIHSFIAEKKGEKKSTDSKKK